MSLKDQSNFIEIIALRKNEMCNTGNYFPWLIIFSIDELLIVGQLLLCTEHRAVHFSLTFVISQ